MKNTSTASILIPTFNHTEMIRYAVKSVQQQTIQDFEILIVGDGAPAETDNIVRELLVEDDRITYFPHLKDSAQGEIYRHEALQHAKGKIICYLSDDDLWLPNHLEIMSSLLSDVDFGHTLHTMVNPDRSILANGGDLRCDSIRKRMLHYKWNLFGLSVAGHTQDAYSRLSEGWRPRPEGMWCDLHMWRQWLLQPWVKFQSEAMPTTLHFPSDLRQNWTMNERLDELDYYRLPVAGRLPTTRCRRRRKRSSFLRTSHRTLVFGGPFESSLSCA